MSFEGSQLNTHNSRLITVWPPLRRAPLLEQACGVSGDRMQRRRPSERARSRTSDDLIQRQGIGIWAHLGSCFLDRHVTNVGTHREVWRNRRHEVVDPLVALVVGVVNS